MSDQTFLYRTNCDAVIATGNQLWRNPSCDSLVVCFGNSEKLRIYEESCKEILSNEELERMDRFTFEKLRLIYALSHGFLRKYLSDRVGHSCRDLDIRFFDGVKPYLKEAKVDFNLSHASRFFAFGVVQEPHSLIGIDLEELDYHKDIDDLVRIYFHPAEQDYVFDGGIDKDLKIKRFYEIWTRKEAFLKMIGVGLDADLKQVNMSLGLNKIELDVEKYCPGHLCLSQVSTLITDQFVISVSSNLPAMPHIFEIGSVGVW